MAKGFKANRDMALQLEAVRRIAKDVSIVGANVEAPPVQDARKLAQDHFEDRACEPVDDQANLRKLRDEPTRLLYEPRLLKGRLDWAKGLTLDGRTTVEATLKRALNLGPMRRVAIAPELTALDAIEKDFPHCGEVLAYVRRRAVLSRLVPFGAFRLPPLLLAGPPGTGKTALSQRLAKAMNVPVSHIDMSTVEAGLTLTGLDAGYSTGKPGLVWDALQQECMSPVIVLDEIEKQSRANSDTGLGFLLGLFEPLTAKRFQDSCLGLPVDGSYITWISTCNEVDRADGPLLSRMRVFQIGIPALEQMPSVVQSVYRDILQAEEWGGAFPESLPRVVIEALGQRSPREIRQAIEDGCANAAEEGRCELRADDLPIPRQGPQRAMGFL